MNPSSRFHLSFNLGYPNAYDRARKRTGGALMIHGSCVSIGCFAMTNPVIEEIWTLAETALRSGQGAFAVPVPLAGRAPGAEPQIAVVRVLVEPQGGVRPVRGQPPAPTG